MEKMCKQLENRQNQQKIFNATQFSFFWVFFVMKNLCSSDLSAIKVLYG
jgi:hypothetical protein